MIEGAFGLVIAMIGLGIVVTMLVRARHLSNLARLAITGSAFGLFMTSRYVEVDHTPGAIIFGVGVAVIMLVVALAHLRRTTAP